MAKLHSYFVLCPLIDQKSFLGVSEDNEPDYVIVSLGRNVVNRYRLSDQKQVGGWTSKDHITSAVIYDKEQNAYVGVFNKNVIKIWKDESDNLDKLKKYKFSVNILKLVTVSGQPPLVIFDNGNSASLPYALENRKSYENIPLIKENETIVDVNSFHINNVGQIYYVVKSKEKYEIIFCPIREELGDLEKSKMAKVKISRQDDVYVVGELISCEDRPAVYVLWSDSKMTMFDIVKKSWKTVGSVPWISTLSSVSIAWMGKNHLILFGSNLEQDGAIIVAYNIVLGVGSCRYPMKMYSEGARLCCHNDRIILEASNHIGMLPYVLETKRNLSSLLGSHEIVQDEHFEIADWDTPTTLSIPVSDDTKELVKVGITERTICAQVVIPLLDKKDSEHILRVIKEFKDVPESVLVQLLNYALKSISISSRDADVTSHDEFSKWYSNYCNSDNAANLTLLNHILQIPFCDALLIPYLRESLSLNDTLFLLTYISFSLVHEESDMNSDSESKLMDWCTLIMDAFYQQFLMTKDEKATKVLENTTNTVSSLVNQIYTINNILPLLNNFLTGKVVPDDSEEALPYNIEMMQI